MRHARTQTPTSTPPDLESIVLPPEVHVDALEISRFRLEIVPFFRAIPVHPVDATQLFASLLS